MAKFIFVVGGVYSGCGKGISCASIALLMKHRGHKIEYLKLDPYLNVSASVIRPSDHGEVFVTDDGSETDLDLGHLERIASLAISGKNICTAGTLYKELLDEDQNGVYLGQTLQVIPHFTQKIMRRLESIGENADIVIAEIGGSVGDIESNAFFEAIREMKAKYSSDCLVCMTAPIIYVPTIDEFKTKPLQRAVRDIHSFGFTVDVLLCRSQMNVPEGILDKVAALTGVLRECVILAPDVKSIYQVPLEFYSRSLDALITDKFGLRRNVCRIHKYKDVVEKYIEAKDQPEYQIGVIGKYDGKDCYLSLNEAIYHAAVTANVKVKVRWIRAEDLENVDNLDSHLSDLSGIIVPGGFDCRGVMGKIKAIQYAREHKMPFLGICLGLQCAVIEFARHIGLTDATSAEFEPETKTPVIHFVEGQENIRKKCGTMRLGAYECVLDKDTLARSLYKKRLISERHRHRYEVNDAYTKQLEKHGLIVSGRHPETSLIEVMELKQDQHPFFIGTQAHPEFKSRLGDPSPLFSGLIAAAMSYNEKDHQPA